ncbi:MAG: right-handed parallel beta-helix repeat-containing protein [Balneolaceae bacterium]|nr:right-handed parallel beta-helix repeat-containing protein [Balneolaceae bacterium]
MSTRRDFLKKSMAGSAAVAFSGLLPLFGKSSMVFSPTVAGEVRTPYPTVNNLAVEWFIDGDFNLSGVVYVEFREKGSSIWQEGMPLRRVPAGSNVGFSWANKHSGSIFNLKPDTVYEIRLSLEDPDGGSEQRLVEAKTRPEPRVGPNAEIIEIAPGSYDILETKSGTESRPVVYRCSEGEATFKQIDVSNKKWVFIEKLNVVNNEERGQGIILSGAENCVVWHCNIKSCFGIVAYIPGAVNCYISDNTLTGINNWVSEEMGPHSVGEGIEITGPGNVICYNKVTGFHDNISTMEDRHVVNQTCIDIHNNDIHIGAEDGIEADFCFSNCRIYENRMTNCFTGLSSQPGLGGPTYFIRNVMYNVTHLSFKLTRGSVGDVILHNTAIKVGTGIGLRARIEHTYLRNNLAIGGPNGERTWGGYGAGSPYAVDIAQPGEYCSFDYNAVGVYGTPYVAEIGGRPFSEVEKNGIERITMEETFDNVPFPDPPIPEWTVPDLRPKADSRVVNAGVRIPNINDNYRGSAPDCGAYEAGQELPHYGPRPYISG